MPTKACFKCQIEKPLTEFYAHPRMFDGHLNKCKSCTKKDTKQRVEGKQSDPDWVLKEAERQRKKENSRRLKPGFIQVSTPSKEYRGRYPEKYAAHKAVNSAIKCGNLERKPCEVCGKHLAQAHHDDYSKPLDVIWLCSKHHAERHVWLNDQKRIAKALALKAQRESQQP